MTDPVTLADGRTYTVADDPAVFDQGLLQRGAEVRLNKPGGAAVWLDAADSVVGRQEADGRRLLRVMEG